ncbi:MAG: hypothetical protein ACUVRZ_04765 [Desulfobacca sp.]|uniref:hypothetical protein n=1 Tax=Desulfobacca sp. TaxID=2067990 RepID=UPI00404A80C6
MTAGKGIMWQRSGHYFAVQVAVVEARPGESNEEAWRRHVRQHPQDRKARVKIFNRCPGGERSEKRTPS